VRIINKEYRSGRYYETKMQIVDVLDEYHFTAINEKGKIFEDLCERDI